MHLELDYLYKKYPKTYFLLETLFFFEKTTINIEIN